MLSHSVYVGGINNLSDARYSAGMFVDQIGIPVGGEFGLSESKINEMLGWLSGVRIVGQLHVKPEFDVTQLPFDGFEVSSHDVFDWLASHVKAPIGWRTTVDQLAVVPAGVDFIVIENGKLSEIEAFPNAYWELNQELVDGKVWLQFPNMKIALQGGTEERPGFSNFGDLIEVLEALEVD